MIQWFYDLELLIFDFINYISNDFLHDFLYFHLSFVPCTSYLSTLR